MKTYLGRICFGVFIILAIMAPAHLYAACQIVGTTPDGGYIIVCDGPDTIGVASGDGNDIITINVGADVTKTEQQSVDVTATATATTINAEGGNDQINNKGRVGTNASMTINTNDVVLTLLGSNEANASVTGNAVATGIDGGTSYQKDLITNNGTIDVAASSKVIGGQLQLDLFDVTKADATLKANATATGIKGTGSNEIINNSTIAVTSTASVTAWTGETNVLDGATANTTITPKATSTGITGGDGYDKITNTGVISVTANAEAYANVLELNVIDAAVMGAGVGSSEDPMKSVATGINAGDGGSEIVNSVTGRITANANSTANIASVILTLYDTTIAADIKKSAGSTATHVTAFSAGISGGSGSDSITNDGEINANATSLVASEGLGIAAEGVPSGVFPPKNFILPPLADATITATSEAIGIQAGAGDDHIANSGKITATADTKTIAATVSVSFPLLELTGLNSPWIDYPPAIAIAGAGTEGKASAWGIRGGEGNDTISNNENPEAIIDVNATSTATTTQVSVALQNLITAGGGAPYFVDFDYSLANAATKAESEATGIDGEGGNDFIENKGSLNVKANSTAIGNAASVVVEGLKGMEGLGVAIVRTKVGTEGTATAMGITGGEGDDEIHNTGQLNVDAYSRANSFSANVSVQGEMKGVGVGVAFADATTTSTATATGISGGDGEDYIMSSVGSPVVPGSLHAYATSEAYAESFSVVVQPKSTGVDIGGALAHGTTTATATATGIDGGKGNDLVQNFGATDVKAAATTNNFGVAVDVQGSVNGLGLGVAFIDASSTATSTATGISGGEGDDTIHSGVVMAYAESDSYSELFSVNVQGTGTGVMIGGAIALAGSNATATATGMDGGAGKDDLINEGFTDVDATSTGNSLATAVTVQGKVDGFGGQAALANTSTDSKATAIGILGGDGPDTITNNAAATVKSHATAEAYAESVSVSVQGYGTLVTMAGSLARGVTTPTATATGISGGEGDDILINHGLTDVKATTDSTSVAVAVRAVGVIEGISIGASLTDTSTTANATAIGADGGLGNDVIYNSGTILANTDSTLRARSVSFDFGGVPILIPAVSVGAALASASTNSTGTAIGISGGEGDDTVINANGSLIDVDSTANATSTAVSISANVIGAAWTDTSATTLTQTVGISGGEGKDGIANLGTIDVDSNSTAKVANVSFNLIGATPVSGWTSSTANATGIDGGLGDDSIQNERTVTADATSTTDATGVAVQVAGYSNMDITTNAIANATGINGGDGVNTIYNTRTGSITATATAYADTTAVNINLLGYSKTDGSSIGAATAIGIAGGKEADTIQNDGTLSSTATSNINASSTGVQLVGYGESDAKGISNATVKGIDEGDGVNTLVNIGSITGTATANADASSYDIQLGGSGKATAGTEANATAIGIVGGKDMDAIRNEGTINLTAQSTLVSESRSYKIFGVGIADADSTSLAFATGIDGAEGPNTITNTFTGSITVSSNASATATGVAADIGAAGASASTTSKVHSTGIKSGSGEDAIINQGILNVKATSSTYAGSGDLSLIGLSFGASITEAVADGIVAGDGKDVVTNSGTITVGAVQDNDHPMAYSNVDSVSVSLFNISFATFGSTARATGIIGGGGDDTITNTGTIIVGDDHWMAKGRAYGFSGQFFVFFNLNSVGATAEAVSTGIEGGDGNDTILNDTSALLTVKASSYARAEGAADVTTFGSPAAFASSTTKAMATGISGGEGNDVIENRGAIDVYVHTWADASSDSWVGWGSPTADSTANATATAVGIDAGQGQNFVTSSGLINVSALAETTPWAKANSDVDVTDAEATSYSKSTVFGILVGDDDNIVNNTATGAIIVTAIARTSIPQGKIANAESDEVATASVQSTSSAIGIQAGKGNNLIINDGQITVGAEVNPNSHASASSMLYTATATAKTGGSADATGIKVGDGNNTIRNDGTLTVTVANEGVALSDYPSAHLDNAFAYAGGGDTSLTSNATGISAGNGVNIIENHRSIIVSSSVDADARAYANTATTTTYAEAYAGGNAKATGIIAGNGQNTIKNYGHMTVSATGNAYALGNAEEYGSAYIGSESSPGIVAEAVGISAGHGINAISNTGTLEVNATATATAEALGDNSTQTVANSYATATGIRTADGINTVTNSGTMNVAANGLDSSAVGIQTGAGNDSIINYGTISATNTINGVTSLGIAISTGGGNDQLFLMNGSTTTGSIDLGEGDDWLTFRGIPMVNGNVTGAAGIDTLVFEGAGSIGFTPMAFENAIKQGPGTYSVASLPTMQRIEIKGGVLQVNDNYQFSDSGFLETFVNGDGSFGQLKVNGTTELAGDLSVLKGPGPYLDGTTYNIIEADAVSDAFSNVTLPEPNNFVSFEMNQLPALVQIEVNVKDFTWLARNRVEWAVANYLDRTLPSVSGDLSNILAQIQNLSKSEFSTALSTLSSDSYDVYTRTTYSTAQQYAKSLQYRMNNIRSYQYANLSDDEKPILLAFRGSDVGQLYNPEKISQMQGKNGLWFDAFGQWGDQDEKDGYTGYDYFMRGATLGFDHSLTNKLMAGVSVGYSRTDIDLNRNQGSGYIKSLLGSIYGSYFNKNLYVDGALSYGRNWYDNHRLITIGPVQRKAYSEHDGDLFSAYLGAGYYFDIKKWLIGPFASLQYAYLDEESFREKGAGSVSLNIDDRQTDSLVSELGVRLARIFKTKCGSLIPEVSAAWLHDFDIDDRVITSSFAGSPGASFSIKGQDVERNGATLGAGITFIHKSGLSTSLKYKGEFREKYKSNAIMGELRFTF